MTAFKSIKAIASGIGASALSLLGVCCGGGACLASCGTVCAAPLASVLGVSSAGFSSWTQSMLPLFTAISAAAFTIAYFALYKSKAADCCEPVDQAAVVAPTKTRWAKPVFWAGLILTMGLYANTMISNSAASCETETLCCESSASCESETSEGCDPKNCTPEIK